LSTHSLDPATPPSVQCVGGLVLCRKDVRLPVQLQRAMAAEAEATREAKAKVRDAIQFSSVPIEYIAMLWYDIGPVIQRVSTTDGQPVA